MYYTTEEYYRLEPGVDSRTGQCGNAAITTKLFFENERLFFKNARYFEDISRDFKAFLK
jgi:hypothetical protein